MTDMRKERRILHNCIIHILCLNIKRFRIQENKKLCYDALPHPHTSSLSLR